MKATRHGWIWLLAVLALAAAPFPAADHRPVDKVLAIVNDTPIFLSQYRLRMEQEEKQLKRQMPPGDLRDLKISEMRGDLFNAMLRERLLVEKAKETGIDIAHVVDQTKEDFKKQNKIADDASLRELLEKEDMTMEEFLQQIERNMVPQIIIRREVIKRIEATEEKALEYYEANKEKYPGELRMLASLYFFPNDMPSAKAKAEAVSEGLRKGLTHAEVSEMHALERGNGKAEIYEHGDLLPALEDRLFAMQENDISEPILTERGYYVVRLLKRNESGIKPFEEVKDSILQRLRMETFESQLDQYVEDLKVLYFTEIYEPDPNRLL